MIIGDGDIGSMLNDREGALFFASGVSNSGSIPNSEYIREWELLCDQPSDLCCFYFSSISVFSNHTDYTNHKKVMEYSVKTLFKNYNIIRIGNIDWGDNPHTFLNYLKAKKKKGGPIIVRDEWRYMISKEELLLITDNLPLTGQNEINVFGRMGKVKDLI